MKKLINTVIFTTLSFSATIAAPITPQEALSRLDEGSLKVRSIKGSATLVRTVLHDTIPSIYLFEAGDKTLILPADDSVTPLLGYSDSCFSSTVPAAEAWIQTLAREIAAIRGGERCPLRLFPRADGFEPIEPLCKTRWNQGEPYNNECPEIPGEEGRTVTGCIATSMAQVMKYHRWPERPTGKIEYDWGNEDGDILSLDFSTQTFFWGNMLDQYISEGYSAAQASAVATLMKCCGYAVEMKYGTLMSGAMSPRIVPALGTFFRYDMSRLQYVLRDYIAPEEWEPMIYRSLKEDGPVILNGHSRTGGHSFVCDGYDRDGYFHINWGWGGLSDGYYLLSVLDPYNQGIGGSDDNSGFNYMQDAIIGIVPDYLNKNQGAQRFGQLYSDTGFDIDYTSTYVPGENVGPFCREGVFNYGPSSLPENTFIGLLFRSLDSDEYYIGGDEIGAVLGLLYGFKDVEIPVPEDIVDGRYYMTFSYSIRNYSGPSLAKATPGNRNENEEREESNGFDADTFWIDVKFPYGECQGYYAEVNDGRITLSPTLSNSSGADITSADMAGAPIRYFNLQGIEMKAPRKGEACIEVSGKKTRKIRL